VRRLALLLGVYAAGAGLISFIGWAADVPRLTAWSGNGISIQPNTTVAGMAAGSALVVLALARPRLAAALGAFAGAIGASTLFEHLFGVDLGIDSLLLFGRDWGSAQTLAPGRMGAPAATSWTFAGAALVLQLGGARARRAAAGLGVAVIAIASLSLTGYAFGASTLYSVPSSTAIALQTATILLAVGLGIAASLPERQPVRGLLEDSAAGLLTRRMLLLLIGLPLGLGYLRVAGQNAGLYDTALGTALLVLALIGLLCAVLWWSAAAVRTHERALAAVAERDARAELVLREIKDQFFELDADGRYVFVNDAVCQVTGLARERLVGRRLGDLVPATLDPQLELVVRRVRERQQPEVVEYPHPSWQRWFENRVYPVPGGGVALLVVELTERKLAEAALRQSEERFRTLVSLITDVPWLADAEGGFVQPQPAWSDYTGQSFEELRGYGWAAALHPEDRARVRAVWEGACQSGLPYAVSGRLWNAATSEYRHFVARAAPLRGMDAAVREWVGACTDVHDTKARELALATLAEEREQLLARAERARAEAEAANRAKDDFLAILSHELRAPLSSMLGWAGILADAPAGSPLVPRAVATLDRNIRAQAKLIDDLLDISRVATGKLQLARSSVDLSAVVTGAVESMRPAAEEKGLAVALEIRGERFEVSGDAARLQQVATNVIQNAVKFTPEGGHVWVRLRSTAEAAELEVEDDGQGIDAALLPLVFDRFIQSESITTRRYGGLGLGLAIVKHLAALHGGAVRAESGGPGCGARFTITLPLAPAAPSRGPSEPPGAGAQPDLSALDVLVVEDDVDSRDALLLVLEGTGARVRGVGSVREALAAYAERPPDLLLSDVAMPDADGYTLIRAIRAREAETRRRTPALAMTGFASARDHDAALRAGFDAHIAKPVDPAALIDRVRALAAARRPLPEA
jgi:PAS domain S-box-containing protein